MGHADPALDARGDLADTPFAHVLLYLYRHAESGTLRIEESDGKKTDILFRRGRPISARFPIPVSRIFPGLLHLCGLTSGSYDFVQEDRIGSDGAALTGAVDPYSLVGAALERHTRDDAVAEVLARHGDAKLRIRAGRDISRLALGGDDAMTIDLLRAAPSSVDQLVALVPHREQGVRRLLYALSITHMIGAEEGEETSDKRSGERTRSGVASISSTPPGAASVVPGPPGQRPSFQSVNAVAAGSQPAWQRLASMRGASHSSRPPGASHQRLAFSSHPPAVGSTPPRGTPAFAPPPPDAPLGDRFRHAERLFERDRYEDAVLLLDDLIAADTDNASYHGLKGLALFRQTRKGDSEIPREIYAEVKTALGIDDEEPRALYTRGLLLKRGGDLRRALAAFQRAARVDPHNLDAKREVQLLRRRLRMTRSTKG